MTDDHQRVAYTIEEDIYTPPDDHVQVDDGTYAAPYTPKLEQWDSQGLINVTDWEYGADREFGGPPELGIDEDDFLKVIYPNESGTDIRSNYVGTWECQRCGREIETKIRIGDEYQSPYQCPSCDRQGPFLDAAGPEDWSFKKNGTIQPIWDLPTGVEEASMEIVWDTVHDFISTHWDSADRDYLYDGLTAFALSTWFRPALNFVPHLLVMGKTTAGKTRLLNTLSRVCYRAFVTASTTPSHVFRSIDEHQVSYFISEYHDLPDEVQDSVDAIVKAGQKRGEKIGRNSPPQGTGTWTPETFDPFTHAAVATQFEPRDDIVNRCFLITSLKATGDVPLNIAEPNQIREQLLYCRFRYLNSGEFEDAKQTAIEHLNAAGIKGRLREKLVGVVAMAELADRDISTFVQEVIDGADDMAAGSKDALAVRAMIDTAFEKLAQKDHTALEDAAADDDVWADLELSYRDICRNYEEMTDRAMSPSYLGHIVKRLGLSRTRHRDGTYIQQDNLHARLKELAEENNIPWETTSEAGDVKHTSSSETHRKDLTQDERVKQLRVVLQNASEPLSLDTIVDRMEERGVMRDQTEYLLEKFRKSGDVANPEGEQYFWVS